MPTKALRQIEEAWALVDQLGELSVQLDEAIERAKSRLYSDDWKGFQIKEDDVEPPAREEGPT